MLKTLTLRLIFGLLASAVLAGSFNGQAAPISIAGHYTETLGKMHLRLHVHQDSGGKLTGTLDSVDKGDNELLCYHFVRSGSKFSFSVPSLDGTYEGETNADRTVISGIWKQGAPTPLKFIREVPATAASLSGQLTEIDAITSAAFAKDHIGSVTVGVVCGNELVWTRNYGDADMEKHRAADKALSGEVEFTIESCQKDARFFG